MQRWQGWAAATVVVVGLATAGWMWTLEPAPEAPAKPRAAKVSAPEGPVFESEHYRITTFASSEQTRDVAAAMEALHHAYLRTMGVTARGDGKLSLVLYKDRAQFQAHNRSRPWAEAYYLAPHCYAYVGDGRNPYHWMVHEGVHQLNRQVAGYRVPGWINEGLASYFNASRIIGGALQPGVIDRDTYPIWWLGELWLSGDRQADIAAGRVLPLRTLMRSDRADVNRRFNTYYIGYWSLSHFLFHYRDGQYAQGYLQLIRVGGGEQDFERLIGPIDRIEAEWYGYLVEQAMALQSGALDGGEGGANVRFRPKAVVPARSSRRRKLGKGVRLDRGRMRNAFAILALMFTAGAASAGEPGPASASLPFGLQRVTIESKGAHLDILARHDGQRRPVLVILPGSACMSAFMLVRQGGGAGGVTSVMPPSESDLKDLGVHLAILERRNIRSYDHVYTQAEAARFPYLERHVCSDARGGVTLEQRSSDVLKQIEYLRKQDWVGEILLAGISEGSDVASAVAASSSDVHALLLIIGAGMSQFFDYIYQRRLEGDNDGVAKAFAEFDAFLSGKPPSTFQGLPAQRWRSFAIERTSMESLMSSAMPVFIVHGDNDKNVPVASVDATVVEVMRKQPDRPVYYLNVIGADHDLRSSIEDPAHEIYPEFVRWSLGSPQGRTYRALTPNDHSRGGTN